MIADGQVQLHGQVKHVFAHDEDDNLQLGLGYNLATGEMKPQSWQANLMRKRVTEKLFMNGYKGCNPWFQVHLLRMEQ